ncbi:MAG: hypothetical protein WBA24_01015 [Geitlerinemataceae cyanobacterium]
MPSSSPSSSESPSPSSSIRRWQHTDSPLLWSNAVVGSLILHLLILVPIARIWIGDRSISGSEKLIAVEVLSPSDSSLLPSPPSNVTPQPSSPLAVDPPVVASATSPHPTPPPSSPTPTPTATPTPSSPTPTPTATPTPSSPTPTPTAEPTPSSPTPTPTAEPPAEESDSPAANPPFPDEEIPPEESGGNFDVPEESSPPSNTPGASDAEGNNDGDINTGDINTGGTMEGLVVYRKSELPAGGCGGSCPDKPAQPQITSGEGFSIAYLPTERHCSGKTLVITALVSREGNATSSEVNGSDLDPNDPCVQIGSSMVNGWSFQPAQSGGSPVDSFLDIYLDLT